MMGGQGRLCGLVLVLAVFSALMCGCGGDLSPEAQTEATEAPQSTQASYASSVFDLTRAGVELHLECLTCEGAALTRDILLLHGSSLASHEFDCDYKDYSLARRLAREGYRVWLLDIAGYGQSGDVACGLMVDTAYAAKDIEAAVELICQTEQVDSVDILGWSWGTMTASAYVSAHPDRVGRLVLSAPIVSGIGAQEPESPFHKNSWESASEDFQRLSDGSIDYSSVEPAVVGIFCSDAWRYNKDLSPNGWMRDACVDETERLIDFSRIQVPTLVIYGDKDPNLDTERIRESIPDLPEGSACVEIEGGSHVMMYERACYHLFQQSVVDFLLNG